MSKIKLRPLDDRVVVQPLEAEERTAGGVRRHELEWRRPPARRSGGGRNASGSGT